MDDHPPANKNTASAKHHKNDRDEHDAHPIWALPHVSRQDLIFQAQTYLQSHEWKSVCQHHPDLDLPTTIDADQIGAFADQVVDFARRRYEFSNIPGSKEFVKDWRQAIRELKRPVRHLLRELNALAASLEQSIAIQPRTLGRNMVFYNSDLLLRQVFEIKRATEEYLTLLRTRSPEYEIAPKDRTNWQPIPEMIYEFLPRRGLGLSFQGMILKQWLEIEGRDPSCQLIMFALACAWGLVSVSKRKRDVSEKRREVRERIQDHLENQKFRKASAALRDIPERADEDCEEPSDVSEALQEPDSLQGNVAERIAVVPQFSSFKRKLDRVRYVMEEMRKETPSIGLRDHADPD
jgi:hypothetical protein